MDFSRLKVRARILKAVEIVLPSAIALVAAIFSFQTSGNVEALKREIRAYEERKDLSDMIIEGIKDFSPKSEEIHRGKLRYLAIYRMAKDDDYKLLLKRYPERVNHTTYTRQLRIYS